MRSKVVRELWYSDTNDAFSWNCRWFALVGFAVDEYYDFKVKISGCVVVASVREIPTTYGPCRTARPKPPTWVFKYASDFVVVRSK
jgi:hypothetical protein